MSIIIGTDSYVSVEDATTYLGNYFDTDNWTSETEANKEIALKQATRRIDSLNIRFSKYDREQSLEFPRSVNFECFADTAGEIPIRVEEATAVEALKILDDRASTDDTEETQEKGIVSQSIENTSVTYDADIVKKKSKEKFKLYSKEARAILNPYLLKSFDRSVYNGENQHDIFK